MKIQRIQHSLAVLATAAAAAFALPAHATDVALAADGSWNEFTVDSAIAPSFGTSWIDFNDGSALTFSFTVAAGSVGTLKVVDASFAGDTFFITDFGNTIGQTSVVPVGNLNGTPVFDFDEAFADATFSRGVFTLGAGTYSISGQLNQSVLDDSGLPLDTTNGAVSLTIAAAVPEPSTYAMLIAGMAAMGFVARRRR